MCLWERAGSVSGVRFAFASGLSAGRHWENCGWFTWHTSNSSPPPGSIHTPAFLFCFLIWNSAKWDAARGNCHILAWMPASLLPLLQPESVPLGLSFTLLFSLSFSFSLSFHFQLKQPTPHSLPLVSFPPLVSTLPYSLCNICNFGLQNR